MCGLERAVPLLVLYGPSSTEAVVQARSHPITGKFGNRWLRLIQVPAVASFEEFLNIRDTYSEILSWIRESRIEILVVTPHMNTASTSTIDRGST